MQTRTVRKGHKRTIERYHDKEELNHNTDLHVHIVLEHRNTGNTFTLYHMQLFVYTYEYINKGMLTYYYYYII